MRDTILDRWMLCVFLLAVLLLCHNAVSADYPVCDLWRCSSRAVFTYTYPGGTACVVFKYNDCRYCDCQGCNCTPDNNGNVCHPGSDPQTWAYCDCDLVCPLYPNGIAESDDDFNVGDFGNAGTIEGCIAG